LGYIERMVLKSQGIKARKRFQFKNRKVVLSVYTNLKTDNAKQAKLINPRNSVSSKRFAFLS
jgi:hypothetical protein